MLKNLQLLTESANNAYQRKRRYRTVVAFIYRCWMQSIFTHNRESAYLFLQKGVHAGITSLNQNPASVQLITLVAFIQIELWHYSKTQTGSRNNHDNSPDIALEQADTLLNALNSSKSFYKSNKQWHITAVISYLTARLEQYSDGRKTVKNLRTLEAMAAEHRESYIYTLAALLAMETQSDYNKASELFLKAVRFGGNSVLMYVGIYKLLTRSGVDTGVVGQLAPTFYKWSASHGIELKIPASPIYVDIFSDYLSKNDINIDTIIKLYNVGNYSWALPHICAKLSASHDFTPMALQYYIKAVEHNLPVMTEASFIEAYIASAYNADYDSAPVFAIRYMMHDSISKDDRMRTYLYHLLILCADDKIIEPHINDMFKYARLQLPNGKHNRHLNTIITYMLPRQDYDKELCKHIADELFTHRVQIPKEYTGVSYAWAIDNAKASMSVYTVSNNVTYVKCGDINECRLVFLGARQRTVIGLSGERITHMVANISDTLIINLYRRGFTTIELLIALSQIYMSGVSYDEIQKNEIDMLIHLLTLPELSDHMRYRISVFLGGYYERIGQVTKAFAYYNSVEDKLMTPSELSIVIRVSLDIGEIRKALGILQRKGSMIPDKVRFYAVKQILKKDEYKKLCANTAYELLINLWYDKELLDIVLNYYKGSTEAWQELTESLSQLGVDIEGCYEAIIRDGILLNKIDDGLQKTFLAMLERYPGNKWIERFVYYIIWRGFTNSENTYLNFDTIKALEDIYANTEDELLAFALAHIYISQRIETVNSDYIIRMAANACAELEIALPLLKSYQDNRFISSYIEKNAAFMYKSAPHKNIFIYYKLAGDTAFNKRQMKYYKFGMYFAALPVFYDEELIYYFEEDGIKQPENTYKHKRLRLVEQYDDKYYKINNALIYAQTYKFDMIEAIVDKNIKTESNFSVKLL